MSAIEGRGFSPHIRNEQAHRHTKKPKDDGEKVLLGEPHLLMFPGDDIEHAIWRREMQLALWGLQ